MLSRYVVVPAVPIDTGSMREGGRYYCKTVSKGFDLYDNQDKQRLKPTFATRLEAEAECDSLNAERLQSIKTAYA